MDEIKAALRDAGLTEGEANVYLALTQLGSTTVGPIIEHAHISSSKVYVILDKLIHKGLATYNVKEKTKHFQAAQPLALLDYIDTKEREVRQSKQTITSIIPKLQQLHRQERRAEEARIFKGYEGIKAGFLEAIDTIPARGTYYFFSTGYGSDPRLQRLFAKTTAQLKSKGIRILGLASASERKTFERHYAKLGYEMRYTRHFWPADITIAGDCVLTLVWREEEPVLYSVRSKEFAASYLHFFQSTWAESDR